MIEVLSGQLHQWDTGRKVKIAYEAYPVDEVHFANIGDESALVVETYEEDGEIVANIPNILLQNNRGIYAYLVYRTESGEITQTRHILKVKRRPKPDDYVYTETEVLTWKALDERLKKVEDNTSGVDEEAIANAVEDYMDKHPVNVEENDPTVPAWAKNPEKPKYTAQEVGALSADLLPTAVNEALAQAKASGEFDGADGKPGEPGQPGADGRTPVKGEDYFTEADKQEIAGQAAQLVKLPEALPNPNALTFTGAVEGNYDGSKPVSIEIPQGGIDVTGAEVGQTIVVKAVDKNGVPTEWEPGERTTEQSIYSPPVGELINEVILSEDASAITVTTDFDGKPLKLKSAYALVYTSNSIGDDKQLNFGFNGYVFKSSICRISTYPRLAILTANNRNGRLVQSFCYNRDFLSSDFYNGEDKLYKGVEKTTPLVVGLHVLPSEYITSLNVSVGTIDVAILAGSKIKIWGVRA